MARTLPRTVDLICDQHIAACDTRWRLPHPEELRKQCAACAERVDPLRQKFGGGFEWELLPALSRPGEYERAEAIHEAGHIVTGLIGGQTLVEAALLRSGRQPTNDAASAWVTFKPGRYPTESALAVHWGGQEALLRHLDETVHDTPENILDAYFSGRHDMVEVDRIHAEAGVTGDLGMTLAQQLLDMHWDVALDIADWLIERTHLPGDEIVQRYGKTLDLPQS